MAGKKGVGGRPRKDVPPDEYETIRDFASRGYSQELIGRRLGMTDRTFRTRLSEDPRVAEAWEKGVAEWHSLIHNGISAHIRNGDKQMLTLAARTQLGWSEKSTVEVKSGSIEDAIKALLSGDDQGDE